MSKESWDIYFYNVCVEVSKNTKCLSRQIGSVLVRDKSIISTGYNGPPRGIPPCNMRHKYDSILMNEYLKKDIFLQYAESQLDKCPRQLLGYKSGEGLELCVAGHAERNSLINAARNGICTKGATLYMNCGIPCSPCMTEIINAGIAEIVVTKVTFYDISAQYLLMNSKVKFRVFEHLKEEVEDEY